MELVRIWLLCSFVLAIILTSEKSYPIENTFFNMDMRNWFGKMQCVLMFIFILPITVFQMAFIIGKVVWKRLIRLGYKRNKK